MHTRGERSFWGYIVAVVAGTFVAATIYYAFPFPSAAPADQTATVGDLKKMQTQYASDLLRQQRQIAVLSARVRKLERRPAAKLK